MHAGAVLLHRDGVLSVRPAVRGDARGEAPAAVAAARLGATDHQRHVLPSRLQDHPPRPQVAKVSGSPGDCARSPCVVPACSARA